MGMSAMRLCVPAAVVVWGCGVAVAAEGPTSAGVSGQIDQEQTWRGQVQIADDVTIGARVTVEAGTRIVFAPAAKDKALTLRVGGTGLVGGSLLLNGSAETPITMETAAEAAAGRVVVESEDPQPIRARWVRFSRLGSVDSGGEAGGEPALFVRSGPSRADVALRDCRFDGCGLVRFQLRGQAELVVERCHFVQTAGRTAIQCLGSGTGAKVVRGNHLDAGLVLACPNVVVEENVVVGAYAGISIPVGNLKPITITGNFVHNSTEVDDGRYCLLCQEPEAQISENVLMGGTYVVEQASRHFHDNIVVGAGELEGTVAARAMTHQLVGNLAPGAVFEGNLLLGPAYAMLATSAGARDVRIVNNTFDGWGQAVRGVHVNLLASEPVGAVICRNAFVRLSGAALVVEAVPGRAVAEWSDNVVAGVGRLAEGIELPSSQPAAVDLDAVGLKGPLAGWPGELEQQLLAGTITMAQFREHLRAGYRPRRGSVLAPAGWQGREVDHIGAVRPE